VSFENTYATFEEAAARLPQTMVSMGNPGLMASPHRVVGAVGLLTPSGISRIQWGIGKPSADFDWQGKRLTIARDGNTDTLPLPPGTQDRLSLLYQFMFIAPGPSQGLEFSMTNGRKLDQYRYTVHAGVEIETRLGRMATVHLVKQHRPDESGAEIWLAPQHRYLPIKMLILEEDGARYEQVITRLEIKSP